MSKFLALSSIAVLAALGFSTPVGAQQRSTVTGIELDSAAARRPVSSRPTAPGVRAVGTPDKDQATVQQSVAQSEEERDLAGGDSVVITSTVLIIILLVVIILIVA
jgi:hypothetical protein